VYENDCNRNKKDSQQGTVLITVFQRQVFTLVHPASTSIKKKDYFVVHAFIIFRLKEPHKN
jgi:hypothetical protein